MQRIFEPFMFTISSYHDTTDRQFKEISRSLSRRSIEQEAVWRQQISYVAYTAPNAQQCVNKVAAGIVEEICTMTNALLHVQEMLS